MLLLLDPCADVPFAPFSDEDGSAKVNLERCTMLRFSSKNDVVFVANSFYCVQKRKAKKKGLCRKLTGRDKVVNG